MHGRASSPSEPVVIEQNRSRREGTVGAAAGIKAIGQQQTTTVPGETDPCAAASQASKERRAKRIRKQNSRVDGARPKAQRVTQRPKRNELVQPGIGVKNAADVGLADADELGAGKGFANGA